MLQDLKYAFRLLAKHPGQTILAIITLSLGIGLTCVGYSTADALVLRPLLVPDIDRLVTVHEVNPRGLKAGMAPATFLDLQRQSRSFQASGIYRWWSVNLTGNGEAERVQGMQVTAGFFDALGLPPVLGRAIQREDETLQRPVLVLSHRLWQHRFGGEASVIGRTVQLNGRAYEIVGVMPPELLFPPPAELWAPLILDSSVQAQRAPRSVSSVLRLRPGVTIGQAQSELDTMVSRIAGEFPETNRGWSVYVGRVGDEVSGDATREYTMMMMGSYLFVLLIACANVANMQLARGPARMREMAVRMAMGSGRWRIIRQLLAESVALAVAGILPGLLLALWGTDMIRLNMPPEVERFLPGWQRLRIHEGVLAFSAVAALFSGLAAGIVPAIQLSLPSLRNALQEGGRGGPGGRSQHRLRNLLVISEVSMALVLLVGATLLIKGFTTLGRWSPELEPASVLTFRVALPVASYPDEGKVHAFYEQMLDKLRTIPRAQAELVSSIPYGWTQDSGVITVQGRPAQPGEVRDSQFLSVSPGYFQLLHIPLKDGRVFTGQDGPDSMPVAIVSERFARTYWPGENPIGKKLKVGREDSKNAWLTVVGISGDVVHEWLDRVPRPMLYRPFVQAPTREMDALLRTSGDPLALAPDARAAVASLDPNLAVFYLKTFAKVISDSLVGFSYTVAMLSVSGLLAAFLAAIGVYAVMAYSVSERTHEIGVRMALGAQAGDVLGWVLRRGLILGAAGLALGAVGAFFLARLLADLILGVNPTDVGLFGAAIALLLVTVAAASYFPARRAAHVEPMEALRYE